MVHTKYSELQHILGSIYQGAMGEPERIACSHVLCSKLLKSRIEWCASSPTGHGVDCLETSQRSFSVPYTGPGMTVSQQRSPRCGGSYAGRPHGTRPDLCQTALKQTKSS